MRLCLVSAVLAEEPVLQGSLKNRFLWGLPTQTGFARLPKTVFVRMVIQKPVFEIPEKPVLLGCHTKSRFCQAHKTPGFWGSPYQKMVWRGTRHQKAWFGEAYLEVLLGSLRAGARVEGDEADRRGCFAVLAGHLEQRALVALTQQQQIN